MRLLGLLFFGCVLWFTKAQDVDDFESNDILFNDPSRLFDEEFRYNDQITNEIPTEPIVRNIIKQENEQPIYETKERSEIDNLAQLYIINPCAAKTCHNGEMCVVINEDITVNALNRTACMCPMNCEDIDEPVCSARGITFKNKCQLHLEACKRAENIEVAYEGKCYAKAGECTSQDLSEFTPRFMEWMLLVREEYLYGAPNMNSNLLEVPGERDHVVEWMFKYLDTNKDQVIGPKEITSLINYLMSVEHCVKDFVAECDLDGNKHIFFAEWKICMMSGSNSVEDTFFDDI